MLLTVIRLAIGLTVMFGTASWAQDSLPQPQTAEEILDALSGGADGGLAPAKSSVAD